MKKRKQKWLVLEDDSGWTVVIPNWDSKPHGTTKITKNKMELGGFDCPCKPKIDWQNKIIIHEAFTYIDIIEKSLAELSVEKPLA